MFSRANEVPEVNPRIAPEPEAATRSNPRLLSCPEDARKLQMESDAALTPSLDASEGDAEPVGDGGFDDTDHRHFSAAGPP